MLPWTNSAYVITPVGAEETLSSTLTKENKEGGEGQLFIYLFIHLTNMERELVGMSWEYMCAEWVCVW